MRVRGAVPPLPPLKTSDAVRHQCGTEIPDSTVLVDASGGLANVVVFLAGAAPSQGMEASPSTAAIDQRRCAYWPPVLAVRSGTEIEIGNSDSLLHNVRANGLFNFAMPVQGLKVRKQLPRAPMTIRLGCDVHPWMHAVIRTLDHPYFALTDTSGRYQLAGVPSGKKKLVYWHERFPEKTIDADSSQAPHRIDLEWSASELRL